MQTIKLEVQVPQGQDPNDFIDQFEAHDVNVSLLSGKPGVLEFKVVPEYIEGIRMRIQDLGGDIIEEQ